MCTREPLVWQQNTVLQDDNLAPSERVLLCAHNMTRRVEFTGADAFIQHGQLQSVAPDERNLFVEAVDYYDARNVLVTVRRGQARALCAALGYTGCDPDVTPAHTVFYFVHMVDLSVRKGRPWVPPVLEHATRYQGLVGCKQDAFLPPLGALVAAASDVGVTTLRVGINTFLLNGIGQVEDMMRSRRPPPRASGHMPERPMPARAFVRVPTRLTPARVCTCPRDRCLRARLCVCRQD